MPQLDGKSIVIIGGTTGLGLSAARAFVAAGARVVVVGRNADSAAAAGDVLGDTARVMTGDATEPTTADRAIATAVEAFGELHGVYHVAGGSGRRHGDGPLHELTDEGIAFTIDLNLKSLIYTNRAAARWFVANDKPGVVLNMGSVLGWSPSPTYFATHTYAATKAAIVGLTKSAAATYAPRGVRFNVIAPALVETPMAQRAANDETIQRFIQTKQPLDGGRILDPADLDAAAVFLMSDAAKMMTGQVLTIDGGWCVSEGQIENDQ
ncbi:MAG: SDR family oxidoreductase [Phycisphaera sp.]|nr:SDR family oxidoreductase [Phycisphaera sp.]